jgi:putative transposase
MRETEEDWLELGRDLTARGLPAPRLVVADGACGLPSAVEEIWPRADRQHCAIHRLRNLQAKLPKSEHDRIRFNYWSALTDATSVKNGKLRLQVLISELEHAGYESAARCLSDDLDALVVDLRYPLRHRERWRSTNLLERSLGEVRRRTKVMGRFPGETSCLSLVWAVLDLCFSHASNGATFTDVDRQHLYRIKYQQADPDTLDEEVTAAQTHPGNLNRERIYSGKETQPRAERMAAFSGKQKPGILYSGRLVFVLGGSALGDRADSRSARNSGLTLTSRLDTRLMISSKHWIVQSAAPRGRALLRQRSPLRSDVVGKTSLASVGGEDCQQCCGGGLESPEVAVGSGDEHRAFQAADDHPGSVSGGPIELQGVVGATLLEHAL